MTVLLCRSELLCAAVFYVVKCDDGTWGHVLHWRVVYEEYMSSQLVMAACACILCQVYYIIYVFLCVLLCVLLFMCVSALHAAAGIHAAG